jgi:hypothetical protein
MPQKEAVNHIGHVPILLKSTAAIFLRWQLSREPQEAQTSFSASFLRFTTKPKLLTFSDSTSRLDDASGRRKSWRQKKRASEPRGFGLTHGILPDMILVHGIL